MDNKPHFPYFPDAYALVFEEEAGVCSVCGQARNCRYTGSFYAVDEPDYLCPWCIADGSAARKYEGCFTDDYCIEGVSPNPADPPSTIPTNLLRAITDKTPTYHSWQQQTWLSHCNQPCVFLGYADKTTLAPFADEVLPDLKAFNAKDYEWLLEHLSKDGNIVGCLFACKCCGQHRLHIDLS